MKTSFWTENGGEKLPGLTITLIWLVAAVAARPQSTTVVAWGAGTNYNPIDNASFGQAIVPSGLTNVVAIAAGGFHNLALKADGTVVAWGAGTNYNPSDQVDYGQSVVPADLSNVVAIAGQYSSSLAQKSDGSLTVWGSLPQSSVPAGLGNAVAIAAGGYDVAVKGDGTVVAWPTIPQNKPPAGLSNVVSAASGLCQLTLYLTPFGLGVKSDGTVAGWGANYHGEATGVPWTGGPAYSTNLLLVSIGGVTVSNLVSVAAGISWSAALKSDGTVIAWGDNSYGQTNPPAGLSNVVAISTFGSHAMALKNDGTVVSWGDNAYGQTNVPPGLSNVVAIAGGFYHSLALVNDGSPFIVRQPWTQTVLPGANVALSVAAVGTPTLTYQWLSNGTNIDGATNATLSLTNVPLTSTGSYQCVVSNRLRSVVSAPATLTVLRPTPWIDTSTLQLASDGLHLLVNGLSGHGDVVLKASTDLLDWQPILTNAPVIGSLPLVDLSATNLPARFYRAEEQ